MFAPLTPSQSAEIDNDPALVPSADMILGATLAGWAVIGDYIVDDDVVLVDGHGHVRAYLVDGPGGFVWSTDGIASDAEAVR